jgi:hypothetical protein
MTDNVGLRFLAKASKKKYIYIYIMKPLCGSLKLQPFHSTLCYPQQLTGVGTIDK